MAWENFNELMVSKMIARADLLTDTISDTVHCTRCEFPNYLGDASRGSLYVRERYPEALRARVSERYNPGHGGRADCNWELYNGGPNVGC
jgi:hypothetical protein